MIAGQLFAAVLSRPLRMPALPRDSCRIVLPLRSCPMLLWHCNCCAVSTALLYGCIGVAIASAVVVAIAIAVFIVIALAIPRGIARASASATVMAVGVAVG